MKKLLLIVLVALNGCGTTPPSTFYVLDSSDLPVKSSTLKNADHIVIGIEPIIIPNYLERPQIVTREKDGVTLTISEFNRWAEQLSSVLPRVLASSISKTMKYPAAKQINLNRDLFQYRLFVEVLRFDATLDNEAVLDVWWTIMTNSGKFLYRTRSTLIEPVGPTYADLVHSEQVLLKKLGKVIGDYALTHLSESH